MACSCSGSNNSVNIAEDSEFAEAYDSEFENEMNFVRNLNSDGEQDKSQDDVSSKDGNICTDMIFVDGTDGDLVICKYEETLMDRVWWSCKPPKIPKTTRVVPTRRIQVMAERLSPTVPGLPTPKEPRSSREVTKNGNRRHKIKSDIDYVAINDFDNETQASCQTPTVTIVPACARRLEDLL